MENLIKYLGAIFLILLINLGCYYYNVRDESAYQIKFDPLIKDEIGNYELSFILSSKYPDMNDSQRIINSLILELNIEFADYKDTAKTYDSIQTIEIKNICIDAEHLDEKICADNIMAYPILDSAGDYSLKNEAFKFEFDDIFWDISKNNTHLTLSYEAELDCKALPADTITQKSDFLLYPIAEDSFLYFVESNNIHKTLPNPFSPVPEIAYYASDSCNVTIKISNIVGELVGTMHRFTDTAGFYREPLKFANVEHLTSGIYFYDIENCDTTITGKMVLLK